MFPNIFYIDASLNQIEYFWKRVILWYTSSMWALLLQSISITRLLSHKCSWLFSKTFLLWIGGSSIDYLNCSQQAFPILNCCRLDFHYHTTHIIAFKEIWPLMLDGEGSWLRDSTLTISSNTRHEPNYWILLSPDISPLGDSVAVAQLLLGCQVRFPIAGHHSATSQITNSVCKSSYPLSCCPVLFFNVTCRVQSGTYVWRGLFLMSQSSHEKTE